MYISSSKKYATFAWMYVLQKGLNFLAIDDKNFPKKLKYFN